MRRVVRGAGRGARGMGRRLRLDAADLAALDGFEGYRADRPAQDNRYNRLAIAVEIDGVPTEVEAYFAVSTV